MHKIDTTNNYHQFSIGKRNGETRLIRRAISEIEYKQDKHIPLFVKYYKENTTDISYSYVEGRSLKNAVRRHLNSKYFVKFDIKSFFDEIDRDILLRILPNNLEKIIKDNPEVYTIMIKNKIYFPQGFKTTPIISEIYLMNFDKKMKKFCAKNDYIITRYADDIIISSQSEIDKQFCEDIVSNELNKLNLKLNIRKSRMFKYQNGIKLLGISIVESKNGRILSIGRKRKTIIYEGIKYTRGNFHNVSLDVEYVRKVIGLLAFAKDVSPDYFYEKYNDQIFQELSEIIFREISKDNVEGYVYSIESKNYTDLEKQLVRKKSV